MDLRTQTSLACGALALAIAASMLLRRQRGHARYWMAAFAADIGLWYVATSLYHSGRAEVWLRFTALLAVLLPQFALRLFEALMPTPGGRSVVLRVAGGLAVPMLLVVLVPRQEHLLVRLSVFLYVFGLFFAGLWSLALRGRKSPSHAIKRRVGLLVWVGALATGFSLADFLWFLGAPLPPVGAVISIVFVFALAESVTGERLVDLYELIGRLLVSTAVAFCLAGIFYGFVVAGGVFQTTYLSVVLAAIVMLVLFEPLQAKVEHAIHAVFFRERAALDQALEAARSRLLHVLEVSEMSRVVMEALEESRRTSGAVLYLRSPLGVDFERSAGFGPVAPARLDGVALRPLTDRLHAAGSVALERLALGVAARRPVESGGEVAADEHLLAAAELLGPYSSGLCVGVLGTGADVVGLLVVAEGRLRDAFSADDVAMLEALAVRIGVVVQNSKRYQRMRERDRLAALGQMAAGLAHEIKNPLGAIKGSAQLLADPEVYAASRDEFLGIILEEVSRLDRVVTAVLDYGRPSPGNPGPVDANAVIRRTLQVLASDPEYAGRLRTELTDGLPDVRVDAEQLRQVLLNLIRNAVQAGATLVTLATRAGQLEPESPAIEIRVKDNGAGIPASVLKNLFVPFFTTKPRGTGLGLALTQRIIEAAGGRLDVSTSDGAGSLFSVLLPAGERQLQSEPPPGPESLLAAGRDLSVGAREPEQ